MLRIFLTLIALLLLAEYSFTQSQSTTGNIQGRVVDVNGAIVTGIAITAADRDIGFARTVQSDIDGNYVFVLLPLGNYTLTTKAARGFAPFRSEIVRLTVGATITREIELPLATVVSVVDVRAAGDGIDTRSAISSTIDERRVASLPSLGRNFLDFATLAPGIIRDPNKGGDLSVGGQKGTFNSQQVDGVNNDNTFYGGTTGRVGVRSQFQFSVDAVREFQINQNAFSAEFGRAAGAVINVVTRSGTNRLAGSAFWYFRDESFNANSPNVKQDQANHGLPNKRNPGLRNQFGVSIGGPIRKDKVFIFGAYEGLYSDVTNYVVLNSLSQAPPAVQGFLRPKVNPYPFGGDNNALFVKTDLNISKKNQIWLRFNQQDLNGKNLEASGILVAEEHTGPNDFSTSSLAADWISALKSNFYNEFRFQYSRDNNSGRPNTSDPEVVLMAAAGENFLFGQNSTSPHTTNINRFQIVNNQTFIAGRHTIKYGADLLVDHIFNFGPAYFGGSYTFPDYTSLDHQLANPTLQFASRYRQSFAGPGTTGATSRPDNKEYGFFVQDDWRFDHRLTLYIGLRYDYQKIAKPLIQNPDLALLAAGLDTSFAPSDTNNIAPRLGFSYALNDRTIVRGGYGIFYGRTPGMMTSAVHSQNGINNVSLELNNCRSIPTVCPIYPAVFSSIPGNVAEATPGLYIFDSGYRQPFTHQANLQFERAVFKNATFSILYSLYRGDDLTRVRDVNLSQPVATVIPVYDGMLPTGQSFTFQTFSNPRPIAGFGRINRFESTANSFYQGLTFEFNRRFSGRWQVNANYTLSRSKDDKPDQSSILTDGGARVAENPYDLSGEYDLSDQDVRHRFVLSPIFESGISKAEHKVLRVILSDYTVAGIFTAQPGSTYSALVSGDPNNDGNEATDRVPGTRRNQFSTRTRYIIDLRLGRTIRFGERYRLMLLAEAYNLVNRSNVLTVNNTLYSFNKPSGGLPARLTGPQTNFGTTRSFLAASQLINASTSSYNREIQLGLRFEF